MPSVFDGTRASCQGCGKKFKHGQQVYSEEVAGAYSVYCEDCFATALMLRLDDYDPIAWTFPFTEVYKYLFPGEKTSRYVKPLMRAMTTLYLMRWDDKAPIEAADKMNDGPGGL